MIEYIVYYNQPHSTVFWLAPYMGVTTDFSEAHHFTQEEYDLHVKAAYEAEFVNVLVIAGA